MAIVHTRVKKFIFATLYAVKKKEKEKEEKKKNDTSKMLTVLDNDLIVNTLLSRAVRLLTVY